MARGGGRRAIRLGNALRLALPLLVALALTARVSAADDEADGRRLFHRGEQFLKVGDYRSAAAAFEAGYAAAPRVGFLLDIGNCYRKLGELGKARQYYWRFLDAAPRHHPARADVMAYLRAMEQIEADGVAVDDPGRAAAPEAAPPDTHPAPSADDGRATTAEAREAGVAAPVDDPAPRPIALAAPAEPVASAAAVAPPPATRAGRRYWIWGAVGAVLAGGVAAALLLARHPGDPCAASLGCARE